MGIISLYDKRSHRTSDWSAHSLKINSEHGRTTRIPLMKDQPSHVTTLTWRKEWSHKMGHTVLPNTARDGLAY